jgi:dihydrofolate synthase/folylpolyglutamate synthase
LGEYALTLPLLGAHQLENAAVAAAAVEVLREQGHPISDAALAGGFARVSWPCRMEVLSKAPLVVVDGAHNTYSVETLLASLRRYLPFRRLLVVAGFSRDKSVEGMAGRLARGGPVVFACASRHPRSLAPGDVAALFAAEGLAARECSSPAEALSAAVEAAGEDDLVLAVGSLFVAAEVREAVLGIEPEVYPELLPADAAALPGASPGLAAEAAPGTRPFPATGRAGGA